MIVQNTFGLLIAVLLAEQPVGKRFLQTVYTVPYLIGGLVVGYLWSLLLSPTFGPVNQALTRSGCGSLARPWLGDPATALPVVILVNAWHYIGFPILLFGAALAGLPPRVHRGRAGRRRERVAAVLPDHAAAVAARDRRGLDPDVHRLLQHVRAGLLAVQGAQGNQPTGPGGATDCSG